MSARLVAAMLKTIRLESLDVLLDFLRLVDITSREILCRGQRRLLLHRTGTGNTDQVGTKLCVFDLGRYGVAERSQHQEQEHEVCDTGTAKVKLVLMIE